MCLCFFINQEDLSPEGRPWAFSFLAVLLLHFGSVLDNLATTYIECYLKPGSNKLFKHNGHVLNMNASNALTAAVEAV